MAENGYKKYVLRTERNRETPPAINFDAIDEAMSDLYQQNSLQQLGNDFPFLYAAGIRLVAKKHNYHYKPVLDLLEQRLSFPAHEYRITWQHGAPSSSSSSSGISRRLLTNPAMQPSDAAIAAMTPALHALCLKVKTNKFTREAPYNLLGRMDARFEQELDYVESLRKKAKEQRDREKAEEVAFEQAQKEGSLVECGCCFSEFVFEKIVACTEGHLFCCGCLNHFVEQTVFGDGKSKLNCITTQGKCEGWFVDAMIVKSVSDKTYKKLQDALASDALKQAQIDNIVSCHVCAYACELGDGAGSILKCPACGAETCKHCGDVSHIPLRCEEVEKKSAQDVRTRVEEAMTKARVRECPNPKCKARFFKVEGCNKMTCTCGWKICYICRLNITKEGYAHFCQQAHCTHASCNKCVLFTDTIEDDRRAMKDAGLSTLNATQNGEAIAASSMEPAKVRTASGQDLTGAAAITALLEARPRGGQGAQPQVQAHPPPPPPLPRVPPPHGYFHMPDGYQILPGGHRRNKRRRQV